MIGASDMTVAPATKGYDTCGHPKRQGVGLCARPAGWGTDHPGAGTCKLHLGSTPSHRKAAALVSARQRLIELTERPLTVEEYRDPMRGLWEQYTEASIVVDYLRDQVMQLPGWTGDVLSVAKVDAGYDMVATSEDARAMVKLYGEWTDRKRKASEACIKAGISERMVQIEEDKWRLTERAVREGLATLGLDASVLTRAERAIGARMQELTARN